MVGHCTELLVQFCRLALECFSDVKSVCNDFIVNILLDAVASKHMFVCRFWHIE